jgi:hypothetical protein
MTVSFASDEGFLLLRLLVFFMKMINLNRKLFYRFIFIFMHSRWKENFVSHIQDFPSLKPCRFFFKAQVRATR